MALPTRTRIEIFAVVIGLGVINRIWGERIWVDALATFFAVASIRAMRGRGAGKAWLLMGAMAIAAYAVLALNIAIFDNAAFSNNPYLMVVVAVGILGWIAVVIRLYRTREPAVVAR